MSYGIGIQERDRQIAVRSIIFSQKASCTAERREQVMGGAIFLGIRRTSGEEVLYETWTNIIPWLFADSSFIEDGEGVDEFTSKAEGIIASGNNIYTRHHNSITYSEYGVVLVDHPNKVILSYQGYCKIGRLIADWDTDGYDVYDTSDTTTFITKLHKTGRLKYVEWSRAKSPMTNEEQDEFLDLCANSEHGSMPSGKHYYVNIYTNLDDFKVIEGNNCGRKEHTMIREFLIYNRWEARVRGTR